MSAAASTSATATATHACARASGTSTDSARSPPTSRAPADRGAAPATTSRKDRSHGERVSPAAPAPPAARRVPPPLGRSPPPRRPPARPHPHLTSDQKGQITMQLPTYRQTVERSEEHRSELQSRPHLVCRLL